MHLSVSNVLITTDLPSNQMLASQRAFAPERLLFVSLWRQYCEFFPEGCVAAVTWRAFFSLFPAFFRPKGRKGTIRSLERRGKRTGVFCATLLESRIFLIVSGKKRFFSPQVFEGAKKGAGLRMGPRVRLFFGKDCQGDGAACRCGVAGKAAKGDVQPGFRIRSGGRPFDYPFLSSESSGYPQNEGVPDPSALFQGPPGAPERIQKIYDICDTTPTWHDAVI